MGKEVEVVENSTSKVKDHLLLTDLDDIDGQSYFIIQTYADYLFSARSELDRGHEFKARKFYAEAKRFAKLHGWDHVKETGKKMRAEFKAHQQ